MWSIAAAAVVNLRGAGGHSHAEYSSPKWSPNQILVSPCFLRSLYVECHNPKSLGNNYLNDFALKIGFDIKRIENELRYRTLIISTVSHPILEVHSGSMNRSFFVYRVLIRITGSPNDSLKIRGEGLLAMVYLI